MRKLLGNRKALSPVVAAIILIAVTVAVSIAVAAWMGALTIGFMKTEELKITGVTWGPVVDGKIENVTLSFVNTGTAKLVVIEAWVGDARKAVEPEITLEPGDSNTHEITGLTLDPGVKYDFSVVTKQGNRYPYTAIAPS